MKAGQKTDPRRAFGQMGERLAVQHLESKGYRVREQNYRCAEGEIDIIAETDGLVAFVEVKCRRGARMGTAVESVTLAKQQRLVALAETYASARRRERATDRRYRDRFRAGRAAPVTGALRERGNGRLAVSSQGL